jgi:hypothetical protein
MQMAHSIEEASKIMPLVGVEYIHIKGMEQNIMGNG